MTRFMNGVAEVLQELTVEPVPLATAVEPVSDGGVPATSGFYSWWSKKGAIAAVPHQPHPLQPELCLLYVGISPSRLGSSGTIRSRVIDQHVRGNTSSSTFRFALASLLFDELALKPRATVKKVVLDRDDDARLRQWQFDHLCVTWAVRERPWEIEGEVIANMQPPLNSAANREHPFHARVAAARAAFRVAGRVSVTP